MTDKKSSTNSGWKLENSYANLPKIFFTPQSPTPVTSPQLVVLNVPLAKSLGLDPVELKSCNGVPILAGNRLPEGSFPIAEAYAGHQFGHFTMLGDGRAVLLGEQINPLGQRYDIQLKGSGRTPYSRGGDGRATLGAMLREYIISEAMEALKIPTSRSLAVTTTGETLVREIRQPGAVLTRVAQSHIRVGTFQFAAKWGSIEQLKSLADYTIERHFKTPQTSQNPYLYLLNEVIKLQAELIAKWQMVGFIHGVMNTDNMVISGETIDYGPCAFMDAYDPKTVFSSIDVDGRYAYENQPRIAAWNLARLAQSLLPLLDSDTEQAIKLAEDAVSGFSTLFHANWLTGMRAKLGIFNAEAEDQALIEDLLKLMKRYDEDFTNTFCALSFDKTSGSQLFDSKEFANWHGKWQARLGRQKENTQSCHSLMQSVNPAIIPRNHRVEEAIDAAVKNGDYSVMEKLLDALAEPYAYSKKQEEFSQPPPPSHFPYRTYCGV